MPGPPLALIRSVPFFAQLSDADAEQLAADFVERFYGAGEVITGEGQQGMSFFIVEEGDASITTHGEAVARLGAGESFGELALFDKGSRRAATIRAESDMRVWSLPVFAFRPFVEARPAVGWALLEHLAELLREAWAH